MVMVMMMMMRMKMMVRMMMIMQVPFVNSSVDDCALNLLDRFCVEAAVPDPCVGLSVQGVYKRSPPRISVRHLKVRSLVKLSRQAAVQDPCVRLSVQGVFTKSP